MKMNLVVVFFLDKQPSKFYSLGRTDTEQRTIGMNQNRTLDRSRDDRVYHLTTTAKIVTLVIM